MKIFAINTAYKQQFQGKNNDTQKRNGVRTAAGAAMIALAAAIPAQKTDAQIYTPFPPHHYQYVPVMKVPDCFIYGNITSENYGKTLPEVFSEIDNVITKNGEISVNEVTRLEEYNWDATHIYPMSRVQKINTANLVKNLSRSYNQKGSNPNTINYSEYVNIMNDYMKSQNAADFLNLFEILTAPLHDHPHDIHRPKH